MSRVIAVIPARMGSTRFPGKPLASLLGRPMIEHVYRRTAASPILSDVIVATCDDEIRMAVERFGGRAVMTSAHHERASDRVAEAVRDDAADIVVMVQGDEPMTRPEMITDAVKPMQADPTIDCVNLMAPILSEAEALSHNTIKVVTDREGNALLFSREVVPTLHYQAFTPSRHMKQVCVIPFRRTALERFAALAPTPLEVAESIDMLRFLEHGYGVRMVPTTVQSHAVDTPRDLMQVERLLSADPYTATYLARTGT
jgi:3-deoxy-manno-octulosonate cytidylyltransferase (CMP-KDO synthetase)